MVSDNIFLEKEKKKERKLRNRLQWRSGRQFRDRKSSIMPRKSAGPRFIIADFVNVLSIVQLYSRR